MKFMHLGDFHLDSAFSGFEKDVADRKRAELRQCFKRALEIAKDEGARFVLISGDTFDTPFCSSETRRVVFEAIEDFGAPVVIAPGNHDYYTKNGVYADKNLPENAFVFTSDELGRFDLDELGVSVIGYAFTSDRFEKNPLASDIPASDENLNILCAHCEVGAPFSKYAPVSANAIARAGFVYAALGHVHVAPPPVMAGGTLIAYSGFPQGRSFDELGEGGAYIVEIDRESRRALAKRVKLSTLSYEIERLDITGFDRDEDVIERIDALATEKNYKDDTALRVVLCGSVSPSYNINTANIACAGKLSRLALLQVRNETSACLDLDYLKDDLTIRGEVYRALLPSLESHDENERRKAALALKFALSALDKHEFGVD